ncbi:MAG: ZIP family metal transporter [Ruminococcaceae bacterium]|nr:ZIP family metal transporter [Oscillospiraceae bacterium]
MNLETLRGIMIPFLGTTLGSSLVFFMKEKSMNRNLQRALTGFASGVMMAASIWSLIIPAVEESKWMGSWSFVPAFVGVWAGVLFLLFLDCIVPHLHRSSNEMEGPQNNFKKTTLLMLAVVLHNIPEGMAIGAVFAGLKSGQAGITSMGALSLSVGIALQNFPEGAIISMPLHADGIKKSKSFLLGVLSGIVEPLGALLIIFTAGFFVPILPYLLGFAAGAMIYVVVEELIPEMSEGEHSNIGTVFFAAGFTVMMALDIALG